MFSSCPHSGTHCLNCDLWDSRIAMIFRSHCPDRDSTPWFSLEQASMSKSQHGLVGAELNARARGRKGLCRLRDDSRKALPICPATALAHCVMLQLYANSQGG